MKRSQQGLRHQGLRLRGRETSWHRQGLLRNSLHLSAKVALMRSVEVPLKTLEDEIDLLSSVSMVQTEEALMANGAIIALKWLHNGSVSMSTLLQESRRLQHSS